jgi:hypothetical protein
VDAGGADAAAGGACGVADGGDRVADGGWAGGDGIEAGGVGGAVASAVASLDCRQMCSLRKELTDDIA